MKKTQRQQLIFCISELHTKRADCQLSTSSGDTSDVNRYKNLSLPSGGVVWNWAANRIMSCVFTFTEEIEGQNRCVTNVIREGYHPSSSAFNEAPLTMQLCSFSTTQHIFAPLQDLQWAYAQSTICSWNGICLISFHVSQFENLNSYRRR